MALQTKEGNLYEVKTIRISRGPQMKSDTMPNNRPPANPKVALLDAKGHLFPTPDLRSGDIVEVSGTMMGSSIYMPGVGYLENPSTGEPIYSIRLKGKLRYLNSNNNVNSATCPP
jgi:hypothetical protein